MDRLEDESKIIISDRSFISSLAYQKPAEWVEILNKYAKKAGVKAHFTPHKLRHTYATTMLEGHADLRSIQELLGHSDISTTTIYTHVNNKKIQNDYERFFPDRKKEGE